MMDSKAKSRWVVAPERRGCWGRAAGEGESSCTKEGIQCGGQVEDRGGERGEGKRERNSGERFREKRRVCLGREIADNCRGGERRG